MDFVATFATDQAIASAKAWREETHALRLELEAVGKLSAAGAGAPGGGAGRGPAFSTASDHDFKKSKWEAGPPGSSKKEPKATGEKDPAKKSGDAGKKALEAAGAATDSAAGALLRYGTALAGLAGITSLTRMAIGWRGMAALQMVSYRAQMDLRRAVQGTDATPLVRAAQKFEQNLSKSTVTGAALSGLLTRGFDGFFRLIEAAEPYATAFFQGLVLGGLRAENMWLKLRLATLPYTAALGDLIGSESMLNAAFAAGEVAVGLLGVRMLWTAGAATASLIASSVRTAVALGGMGIGAVKATASFVSMGVASAGAAVSIAAIAAAFVAVAAAIDQATKLYNEWDTATFTKGNATGKAEEDAILAKGRIAYDQAEAARRAKAAGPGSSATPGPSAAAAQAGGKTVGKALADGMVQGMADGGSAVDAAAGALGKRAEASVRKVTQTHSPSQAFRRVGRDLGAGEQQGLDDSAAGIQRAAEKALVPQVPAGGAGGSVNGGASSEGGAPIYIENNYHFPELKSGDAASIQAACEAANAVFYRKLAIQMGRPVRPR